MPFEFASAIAPIVIWLREFVTFWYAPLREIFLGTAQTTLLLLLPTQSHSGRYPRQHQRHQFKEITSAKSPHGVEGKKKPLKRDAEGEDGA
jgi:hypothetical protein